MPLTNLSRIARSPGDPSIRSKGPSSMGGVDRLARGLGWFSLALGAVELLAPRRITRSIGLDGREGLVRAYGLREIVSGIPTLSVDKHVGLASRIAGDVLDLATLRPALRQSNPRRRNALIALAMVGGVTALDVLATAKSRARHRRTSRDERDYSDRSGLPRGAQASRGLAAEDFRTPVDYTAPGALAQALPAGSA